MSLIEEALRNLDLNKPKPAPQQPEAVPSPAPSTTIPMATSERQPARRSRKSPAEAPATPWIGFFAAIGGSALLVVIGLMLGSWWSGRPRAAGIHATGSGSVRPVPAPVAVLAPTPIAPVTRLRPEEFRGEQRDAPDIELHGIVEGVGEPLVIVNGRIVRLGETIEGATLLEVGTGSVRFRYRDRDVVLQTNQ